MFGLIKLQQRVFSGLSLGRSFGRLLGSFVPSKQWKPGNPLPHAPPFDVDDLVSIDFSTLSPTDVYKFLVSSVIPRPIALVSTVPEKGGCVNLAPISYFNAVCSNPPLLMISITPNTKGEFKDTLINIKKTGSFVINSVSEWQVEPMNATGAPYPYGISEMEKVGFHPLPSTFVAAPRVAESAIQFECTVHQVVDLGVPLTMGSCTAVFGQIQMVHVNRAVYDEERGTIVEAAMLPLARLGGRNYGRTTAENIFDMPRAKCDNDDL